MPVKSRSKTFKRGDSIEEVDHFINTELAGATHVVNNVDESYSERQVSK